MPRDMLPEAPVAPVDLNKIDTLHELLALALGDFEKVLVDDRYVPDLTKFYAPQEDGCHVCVAGAVIVGTLGLCGPSAQLAAVAGPFRDRLLALDYLRVGLVGTAYQQLYPLGSAPLAAEELTNKWTYEIEHEARAIGHDQARAALAKLRLLQADLAEAAL